MLVCVCKKKLCGVFWWGVLCETTVLHLIAHRKHWLGCLNSAQIHLCCFIDNRLSVLLLQSISFIPLFPLLPSSASPSMRGSTPLDVAAASVMDNNELALALREPDLEKVRLTFARTQRYIKTLLHWKNAAYKSAFQWTKGCRGFIIPLLTSHRPKVDGETNAL